MLGRAAAALGARQQRIKHGPQQPQIPAAARAQEPLQHLAQLAYLLGIHRLRLVAKNSVNLRNGLLPARAGALVFSGVVVGGTVIHRLHCAAQAERQQPGLARVIDRQAAHLQGADFGHAGLQLHLNLGFVVALGHGQHGRERRQFHPTIAQQGGQLPGLGRQAGQAVGQQIKAHGLAELECKAPAR